MKITIDLKEGFDKDEVIILEGQKRIFHARDVTTRNEIGLAKSFEIELSGNKPIEITVPSRGIIGKKEINVSENGFMSVSITDENQLEWESSNVPPLYM